MHRFSRVPLLCALLAAASVTSTASAEISPEAQHLIDSRDAKRYNVPTTKSRIDAGGARIAVRADKAKVTRVIEKFGDYDKFIKKFEKAQVVGKSGKQTDVYLRVPILKGAATVWAVVRFDPAQTKAGETVVRGKMIKGNVDQLEATWRIKPLGPDHTQVSLELLIVPKIPAPGSLVTGEVAYAADEAVTGIRDRAEK